MDEQTQLKYLFKAELRDGSVFEQPADDHSELEPERRTAFFDLLEISKENPIQKFSISNGEQTLLVDLLDGHFELNGVVILPQSHVIPIDNPTYKLIYHRTMQRHFNVDYDQVGVECVGTFVGWEVTIKVIEDGKEKLKSFKEILGLN